AEDALFAGRAIAHVELREVEQVADSADDAAGRVHRAGEGIRPRDAQLLPRGLVVADGGGVGDRLVRKEDGPLQAERHDPTLAQRLLDRLLGEALDDAAERLEA